jgi:hypothetical protein
MRQALERRSYRYLFEHPTRNRFDRHELEAELGRAGIAPEVETEERLFGDFAFGVGRRLERASAQHAVSGGPDVRVR